MKLKFKENPKEWRKNAWLCAIGLALLCTLLRWRHILAQAAWLGVLALSAVIIVSARLRPGLFRGFYRISVWLGFHISQFIGQVVLAIFFLCVITPLGLCLRLCGKDFLRLKRQRDAASYWTARPGERPMDRLF